MNWFAGRWLCEFPVQVLKVLPDLPVPAQPWTPLTWPEGKGPLAVPQGPQALPRPKDPCPFLTSAHLHLQGGASVLGLPQGPQLPPSGWDDGTDPEVPWCVSLEVAITDPWQPAAQLYRGHKNKIPKTVLNCLGNLNYNHRF